MMIASSKKYKNKEYVYFSCRSCNSLICKKWRSYEKSKIIIRNIRLKQENKFKEKTIARKRVNSALKMGKFFKKIKCELCNKKTKLDAHHYDYKQPLKVTWICRICHINLHRPKRQII